MLGLEVDMGWTTNESQEDRARDFVNGAGELVFRLRPAAGKSHERWVVYRQGAVIRVHAINDTLDEAQYAALEAVQEYLDEQAAALLLWREEQGARLARDREAVTEAQTRKPL
jgi:hypothetical protein